MANHINIGTITTPNPTLWVDTNTLGTATTEYSIATACPGNNWMYVNQFCSLLSTQWLLTGRGTDPYGLSNFKDSDKVSMAQTLIGFSSLQDQVNSAVSDLGGTQQNLTTVTQGVQNGGYKPGTRLWAGNDFHVIALYVVDASYVDMYDSNTGSTTRHKRSTFSGLMSLLQCNTFVVC